MLCIAVKTFEIKNEWCNVTSFNGSKSRRIVISPVNS